MQIQLEEQQQQPIKQLSIETRYLLLNLQLGGLGSSQDRGQYHNVELFCSRPRKKKSVLSLRAHAGKASLLGTLVALQVFLSSELGEQSLLWALGGGTNTNLFPETCLRDRDVVKWDVKLKGSTAWTRSFLGFHWHREQPWFLWEATGTNTVGSWGFWAHTEYPPPSQKPTRVKCKLLDFLSESLLNLWSLFPGVSCSPLHTCEHHNVRLGYAIKH